ncbi:unnamed protein product [Eretmochelys imbricata]
MLLDEADRILDMGFADTMNAIIENLPKKGQTLLFSATQTKSVKDLAQLSLKDPEYVWVHEKAKFSVQYLFRFQSSSCVSLIRKKKRSTCGSLHQMHTVEKIAGRFYIHREHETMGVTIQTVTRVIKKDFPAVNWVIQFDYPEDANTQSGKNSQHEAASKTCDP